MFSTGSHLLFFMANAGFDVFFSVFLIFLTQLSHKLNANRSRRKRVTFQQPSERPCMASWKSVSSGAPLSHEPGHQTVNGLQTCQTACTWFSLMLSLLTVWILGCLSKSRRSCQSTPTPAQHSKDALWGCTLGSASTWRRRSSASRRSSWGHLQTETWLAAISFDPEKSPPGSLW